MQSVNLQKANDVMAEVKKAVIGKDTCILKVMAAMIAGGHILLDDIPGVGKTTMALAFSKAMDLKQNRVQFTPDILPADIVGFSMYEKSSGKFVYQPGAVMCNLFLADEINRTSPKTQSALLEVMEEGSVTVDGITKPVPNPFIVLATQNPVGSAGTQMLPESQVDRFMICLTMGYPNPEDEIAILKRKSAGDPLNDVMKVMDAASLLEARREAEQIYVHNAIYKYMVRLVNRTRNNDMIELGISPRGKGHGTDKAVVAGLLGMQVDDPAIPHSFEIAEREGLQFTLSGIDLGDVHPNSVKLELTGESGRTLEVIAASIGGGRIEICEIDGLTANFSGDYPTLIVHNIDQPGHVTEVTSMLAHKSVNIATMQLYRASRGGNAVMVIECDQEIPADALKWLERMEGILKVTYLSLL